MEAIVCDRAESVRMKLEIGSTSKVMLVHPRIIFSSDLLKPIQVNLHKLLMVDVEQIAIMKTTYNG
jgi:hypothetical protein